MLVQKMMVVTARERERQMEERKTVRALDDRSEFLAYDSYLRMKHGLGTLEFFARFFF